MNEFMNRLEKHTEHVRKVGDHCTTEETTKQALILPLLDILGFSPYDPTKVKAEFAADFPGAKANERVDYALFCQGVPVMFIEAKAYAENLNNHCPQLARYFNATPEVAVCAITNGKEWRFFTDLKNKNIMDSDPFLTVNFMNGNQEDVGQLFRFKHDNFQPDALRTLAEESVYLSAFKAAISDSLREVDADFVRYVATRAQIQRQLNAKFIESITPLVRQAVERAVSEMVLTGLSAAPTPQPPTQPPAQEIKVDPTAPIVDPSNNKIVTTFAERQLLETALDILGNDSKITPKDTETYFNLLYLGKTNRWILRYFGDKKRPFIQMPFTLTQEHKNEIARAGIEIGTGDQIILDKPSMLMRIPGLLFDALSYCQNDDNFKRQSQS